MGEGGGGGGAWLVTIMDGWRSEWFRDRPTPTASTRVHDCGGSGGRERRGTSESRGVDRAYLLRA